MAAKRSGGLGRGLDVFFGEEVFALDRRGRDKDREAERPGMTVREIALEDLAPGKFQPREQFDEQALAELADSIRERGVLSPVLVRETKKGRYEIIAGERRVRASRLAGKKTVPALVRTMRDDEALAAALVENLQRDDLGCLEEARGLKRLMQEFGFTQEQAARAVGRSRPAAANLLRLLTLCAPVQEMLADGRLDMGHARALVGLPAALQAQLAQEIASRGLSARQAEALAEKARRQEETPKESRERREDPDTRRLEETISDAMHCPVRVVSSRGGRGQVVFRYSSLEELDSLLRKWGVSFEERGE